MARRKEDEPQIFPGATASDVAPVVEDLAAFVYLTDSTETNRVRTALPVNTQVELRCLFTDRALTRREGLDFRNQRAVPAGISVNPGRVICTVTAPHDIQIVPDVSVRDGVYVAEILVERAGAWFYRFEGRGGWMGAADRAFDIK